MYPIPSELYITGWKGPDEWMVDVAIVNGLRNLHYLLAMEISALPQYILSSGNGEFFWHSLYLINLLISFDIDP